MKGFIEVYDFFGGKLLLNCRFIYSVQEEAVEGGETHVIVSATSPTGPVVITVKETYQTLLQKIEAATR